MGKKHANRKEGVGAGGFRTVFGSSAGGRLTPLAQVRRDTEVLIRGRIFDVRSQAFRDGQTVVIMLITDGETSQCVRTFMSGAQWKRRRLC